MSDADAASLTAFLMAQKGPQKPGGERKCR